MGAWFANFLSKGGYRIIISDTNRRCAEELARKKGYLFLDKAELAVQPAKVIVLATPTHVTKKLLDQIGPYFPRRSLIVEISSVKEPIRRTLQHLKRRGTAILSIHPMFGPGVKTLKGKTVITVMIPDRNRSAGKLLSLFQKHGMRVVHSNFHKHDKWVSLTLSLPHFINFAMAQTLRSNAMRPNELRAVGGQTFSLQLLVAEALYQENFSNEASILIDNKHSSEVLKAFMRESSAILSLLTERRMGRLIRDFKKGRSYLRKDDVFPSAYHRFNAAVEASSFH